MGEPQPSPRTPGPGGQGNCREPRQAPHPGPQHPTLGPSTLQAPGAPEGGACTWGQGLHMGRLCGRDSVPCGGCFSGRVWAGALCLRDLQRVSLFADLPRGPRCSRVPACLPHLPLCPQAHAHRHEQGVSSDQPGEPGPGFLCSRAGPGGYTSPGPRGYVPLPPPLSPLPPAGAPLTPLPCRRGRPSARREVHHHLRLVPVRRHAPCAGCAGWGEG